MQEGYNKYQGKLTIIERNLKKVFTNNNWEVHGDEVWKLFPSSSPCVLHASIMQPQRPVYLQFIDQQSHDKSNTVSRMHRRCKTIYKL